MIKETTSSSNSVSLILDNGVCISVTTHISGVIGILVSGIEHNKDGSLLTIEPSNYDHKTKTAHLGNCITINYNPRKRN